MYYVNLQRIADRSQYLEQLAKQIEQLRAEWASTAVYMFAQERLLHLCIECVTDIGNDLIDGFMMRDASSYEDIMIILHGEQVFNDELAEVLTALVRLRKQLVQDYVEWDTTDEHPILVKLPEALLQFIKDVKHFLDNQPIHIG